MSIEERLTFDSLFDIGEETLDALLEFFGPRYPLRFILDEQGEPVPTNDAYAAARLLMDGKAWMVAKTRFVIRGVDCEVSTVFLVHNHAYGGGPPVLWETMIFTTNCWLDGCMQRYTSRRDAEQGHHRLAAHALYTMKKRRLPSYRRMLVAQRRAQKAGTR